MRNGNGYLGQVSSGLNLAEIFIQIVNNLVSVTQLNKADKNTIKKKLEAHGGAYQPELQMDTTNLLVCITADGQQIDGHGFIGLFIKMFVF